MSEASKNESISLRSLLNSNVEKFELPDNRVKIEFSISNSTANPKEKNKNIFTTKYSHEIGGDPINNNNSQRSWNEDGHVLKKTKIESDECD